MRGHVSLLDGRRRGATREGSRRQRGPRGTRKNTPWRTEMKRQQCSRGHVTTSSDERATGGGGVQGEGDNEGELGYTLGRAESTSRRGARARNQSARVRGMPERRSLRELDDYPCSGRQTLCGRLAIRYIVSRSKERILPLFQFIVRIVASSYINVMSWSCTLYQNDPACTFCPHPCASTAVCPWFPCKG